MTRRKYNVLFLCTGNSARSILAEAAMNNVPTAREKFSAYSAGSYPRGDVHPLAVRLLEEAGFRTDGLRSKSWDEFAAAAAPTMDFVITVCDKAAGEQCPFWPGQPMTAHWGVADPAAVECTDEEKRRAFNDAFLILRRRIDLLACLPMESLDSLSLQHQLGEIGQK